MSVTVKEGQQVPIFTAEDECSICIESLLSSTHINELIAKVSPCNHCYHDLCIRSWSEQANSCPKCRCKFNQVDLIDKYGDVIHGYSVQNKEFPVDPNYLAPEIEPNSSSEITINNDLGTVSVVLSNVTPQALPFAISCSLCSGASLTSDICICQSCSSSFHHGCLGISSSYVGFWNCPMCDCMQESSLALQANATRRARRNRLTRRTDSTYERLSRQHRSETTRRSARQNNISTGIQESCSETHICSSLHRLASPEPTPPAVSPEEEEAWKQFEMVRKDQDTSKVRSNAVLGSASRIPGSGSAEVSAPKKLKRPSRRGKQNNTALSGLQKVEKAKVPSPSASNFPSTSRVMSMLSEMHSNSQSLLRDPAISNTFRNYEPQRLYGQLSPPMSPDAKEVSLDSNLSSSSGKSKITDSD